MPRIKPDDARLAAPDFPHGTTKGYDLGCSCAGCREAHSAHRYMQRYGHPRPENWHRSVSTAPAREHALRLLEDPSVSKSDIARAAGVAITSVLNILRKDTVYSTTTDAILAVTPESILGNQKCVDATPSRKHIEHLLEGEDASYAAIAAAAGMTYDVIQFIAEGRRTTILADTARLLLNLTPYVVRRNSAYVSSRRAVTRIRALQANGWPVRTLAHMLDVLALNFVRDGRGLVMQETDRRVEALYNELECRHGGSKRAESIGRGLGYYPPIHYDEDMQLLKDSIPRAGAYVPLVTAQERARMRLRIMGLTIRSYTAAEIVKVIGGGCEKTIERARREVGLRLENNQNILADLPYIKPGQGEMVALIAEHTAPLALLEPVDSVDEPGTDHVALWESLLDGARRVRAAAAYVALWESLLTEAEQSDQAAA